jgi:hypothetical protein
MKRVRGISPESQGQNLALTVLFVPRLLDSGFPGGAPKRKMWLALIS